MKGKSVLYNLAGSIFDKGLPILTTAFITKFMTTHDYGRWALFFAFLIIVNALISSPILVTFSRKFFHLKETEQKMNVYFYKLVFVFQFLCFIYFYLFVSSLTSDVYLEVASVLLMNIYSYIALFCRFKKWDKLYLIHSLVRLLLFAAIVIGCIYVFGILSYTSLLIAFVLCHIPSLVHSFKYFAFPKSTAVRADLIEFFNLSIYGISTSLVSNLDRFVIATLGFSLSFLGYYSFIYALTNVPTIVVEALKKTMTPIMFKEWSTEGHLTKKTMKFLYVIAFVLLFNQIVLPQIAYYILVKFNLVNLNFVKPESITYIWILSLGFYFQNLYHFVNPYYFYSKKSLNLLIILVTCLLLYLFLVMVVFRNLLSYETFMWSKTILLILVTVFTAIYAKMYLFKTNIVHQETPEVN